MLGQSARGKTAIGKDEAPSPDQLIPEDIRHEFRLESPSGTEVYQLNVSDMRHETRLESPTISVHYFLDPEDLQHEFRFDNIFLFPDLDDIQNPPDDRKIQTSTFGPRTTSSRSESPFTLSGKTFEMHGERWEGEFELVEMDHYEFAEWKGWLAVVEGRFRPFYLRPPHNEPRGNVSQNGTVKSINRPDEVTVQGLAPGQSNAFLEGDYIQPEDTDQLMMVLDPSGTNPSGEATLTVKPRIRKDPTGSVVETQDPKGLFCLDTNAPGWQEEGYWNNASFEFVEVVG